MRLSAVIAVIPFTPRVRFVSSAGNRCSQLAALRVGAAMMRVSVHFNLHNKLWSVTALEGPSKGRVIEHATSVYITDCEARVSEMQRQRVIANRCRSVHAKIIGTLSEAPSDLSQYQTFSYNPYRAPGFTCGAQIWTRADSCAFVGREAKVKNPL
jgi:hypothetical protein